MDVFQALSDLNRRSIIELLASKGQLSASDIYSNFQVSPPAISQHLQILKDANLVVVEKKAQQRIYSLNPEKINDLDQWVDGLRQSWENKLDRLDKMLQKMQQPSDSVRIVLFDLENPEKFLILSETDDPSNLKLPGGKFASKNETPDQAAKRELMEELGLEIKLVKAGELINDDGISKRYIYSGHVLKDFINPSSEIDQIVWLTVESVPEGKNKQHILSAVRKVKHG